MTPSYRKSSFSHSDNCVELAAVDGGVAVRDSKDPAGPVLTFTRGEIEAWLAGSKAGEFDDLS